MPRRTYAERFSDDAREFDSVDGFKSAVKSNDIRAKYVELMQSEFHAGQYGDWRRVRSLIEHENILVNHRITWLLLSQGALLSGFVLIFNGFAGRLSEGAAPNGTRSVTNAEILSRMVESPEVIPLIAICWLGMGICCVVFNNLRNAGLQLTKVTRWWYELSEHDSPVHVKNQILKKEWKMPPLHLWRDVDGMSSESLIYKTYYQWIEPLFRTEAIPVYFSVVWACILLGFLFGNGMVGLPGFMFNPYAPLACPFFCATKVSFAFASSLGIVVAQAIILIIIVRAGIRASRRAPVNSSSLENGKT